MTDTCFFRRGTRFRKHLLYYSSRITTVSFRLNSSKTDCRLFTLCFSLSSPNKVAAFNCSKFITSEPSAKYNSCVADAQQGQETQKFYSSELDGLHSFLSSTYRTHLTTTHSPQCHLQAKHFHKHHILPFTDLGICTVFTVERSSHRNIKYFFCV